MTRSLSLSQLCLAEFTRKPDLACKSILHHRRRERRENWRPIGGRRWSGTRNLWSPLWLVLIDPHDLPKLLLGLAHQLLTVLLLLPLLLLRPDLLLPLLRLQCLFHFLLLLFVWLLQLPQQFLVLGQLLRVYFQRCIASLELVFDFCQFQGVPEGQAYLDQVHDLLSLDSFLKIISDQM